MPRAESQGIAVPQERETAEPDSAWRERAIERSTRSARQRAAKRVQQFLDTARDVIADKQSIDFTVQEVVERSRLSLRSFYLYFDGKHELLLALFEEEMNAAVRRIQEATEAGDPIDRLETTVEIVYELCSPGRAAELPLFYEFAQRLLLTHPDEVSKAYSPLFDHLVELMVSASEAGLLRTGPPKRQAAIVLQAATTTAGRSAAARQPITPQEMWNFCLHAICPDDVVAARARPAGRRRRSA